MDDQKQYHFFENFEAQRLGNEDLRGHKFFFCHFSHLEIQPGFEAMNNLYGVTLYGCTAQYLEAQDVNLAHFSAQDCDFRHSNFRSAKFTKSRLHKCDFTWSDFTGADLSDVAGDGSEFKLSKIHKADKINVWDRDMISELIRVKANGDSEVLAISALVKNSLEFCWKEWHTLSKFPQWERVSRIIYDTLKQYPSVIQMIGDELLGG